MAKRYGYPVGLVAVTALLVVFALQVDAAIMTFLNRDSFQSALSGGVDNLINFNSITVDTSFAASAINFGPFTLTTLGIPPAGANKIDTLPFDDIPSVDGTPYASMFVDSTRSVSIDFNLPVQAFGADFLGAAAINFGVFLQGSRGPVFVDGPTSDDQFFGLISTEPFNRITLGYEGLEGTSANVRFDNAALSHSVPEPTSLLLLGTGLALLGSYSCWRLRSNRTPGVGHDQT